MKRSAMIVTVVVALLGGYALTQISSKTEYVAPEEVVVEKEVQVDALDKAIKDAQTARAQDIESVAQKAYEDAKTQELKKIELEVITSFSEKLDERKIDLQKQTKVYWTRERVVGLIKQAFPEDAERALAVAHCESGFNPQAYNGKNDNGTTDGGLFQINSSHNARLEQLGLDKWDPEDNVKFARILYEESGWQPWTCHTRGLAYR